MIRLGRGNRRQVRTIARHHAADGDRATAPTVPTGKPCRRSRVRVRIVCRRSRVRQPSRRRGNRGDRFGNGSTVATVCRQFPAIIATETENRHLTKCRNRNGTETAAPRVCAGACVRVFRVRVVLCLYLYFLLCIAYAYMSIAYAYMSIARRRIRNGHAPPTGSPQCRQTRQNRPPWRSRRSDGFAPVPIPRRALCRSCAPWRRSRRRGNRSP